jgi:DNA polymerase elongation subunit (family B)
MAEREADKMSKEMLIAYIKFLKDDNYQEIVQEVQVMLNEVQSGKFDLWPETQFVTKKNLKLAQSKTGTLKPVRIKVKPWLKNNMCHQNAVFIEKEC